MCCAVHQRGRRVIWRAEGADKLDVFVMLESTAQRSAAWGGVCGEASYSERDMIGGRFWCEEEYGSGTVGWRVLSASVTVTAQSSLRCLS